MRLESPFAIQLVAIYPAAMEEAGRQRIRFCRLPLLAMSAFVFWSVTANIATADTNAFAVTNRAATAYKINGIDNNPSVTLERGKTYTFTVNAPQHPFWITTAPGAAEAAANAFPTGVTENGVSVGTIIFTVPATAPSILYYQCAFHDSMSGTFNIVDGAAAGADAPLPPWTLVLLGTLLFVSAAAQRNRTRP